MLRSVQPEQLDSLDTSDPDAQASRRDLVRINRLMGNYRWFQRTLQTATTHTIHCLEIGAGGGELATRLTARADFANYAAVDLAPPPANWPASATWYQGDILDYPGYDHAELLLANLILHHFSNTQLASLGAAINASGIRHILANEPCRRSIHKIQLRAGRLIGFNPVTLYDGSVSIDAGFLGLELPEKLGLDPATWTCKIRTTAMGAYRMEAQRR
jgi:hypothetical protein